MNRYSIDEVVEMAIQTERLGYQFYTGMAEKFKKDGRLSRLFNDLAEREKTHERIFQDIKASITSNRPEPTQWEDVADYLRAFVQSEFFLGKGKSLPSMDYIKSEKDAVNFAIGFEKEVLLYFIGFRSVVSEKEALDQIINEEKSHIVSLQRYKEGLK